MIAQISSKFDNALSNLFIIYSFRVLGFDEQDMARREWRLRSEYIYIKSVPEVVEMKG
ncbi:hypothetical protein AN958_00277 [Leucoagaricus sp. SymC.cos]|nr:hypothetical protein AN958_00277 [Leucoagaricus sp. SymC.cos]